MKKMFEVLKTGEIHAFGEAGQLIVCGRAVHARLPLTFSFWAVADKMFCAVAVAAL